MAAPEHKVFLIPLKLLLSNGSDRELEAWQRDYGIDYLSLTGGRTASPVLDLTPNVFQINTDKALGLAPGQFTIRLTDTRVKTKSYTEIIEANDLILIKINGGEKNDPFVNVMLGVVVRVSKQTRISGETVGHHVEIQGSDCAQWLYWSVNNFWAYAGIGADAKAGIREMQQRIKIWDSLFPNRGQGDLPSVKILQNILLEYIAKIMPRIGELFRFIPVPTRSKQAAFLGDDPILGLGEKYVPEKLLSAHSGSVATILEEYKMEYLSELWSDTTDDGGFAIFYRRPPYDEQDWFGFLDKKGEPFATRVLHVIPDAEIVGGNVGRSIDTYYNFISVLSWIYGADDQIIPLVMNGGLRLDASSIRDRGFRPLMITQRYLDYNSAGETPIVRTNGDYNFVVAEGAFSNILAQGSIPTTQLASIVPSVIGGVKTLRLTKMQDHWADTLWRWMSQLDRYFSGRLTIKGNPSIRVGHKVQLKCETGKWFNEPYEFYVVAVGHDYDVQRGNYLTSLVLTRGQRAAGFIQPVTDGQEDIAALNAEKQTGQFTNDNKLSQQPFEGDRSLKLEIWMERDKT